MTIRQVVALGIFRFRALLTMGGLGGQIAKASVAALIMKLASVALGFATTVLLARMLGPDGLGVYALALAVVMVLGLPVKAGVPQLVTKETARGQAAADWSTVNGVWRWSTRVVMVGSIALLAVVGVTGLMFYERIESELRTTLAISVLLIPLMGLALVRASSLRGLGHTVQGQLPELLIKPLALLAFLVGSVFIQGTGTLTAPWAMTMNIVASALAFVVGVLLLRRSRPEAVDRAAPTYESRAWLAAVLPMASVTMMHLINTQADILLIGYFMENADVGHYKVAAQISLIVAFGLHATKMVVEPYFSRFYHQADTVRLQRLARAASRVNATLAVAAFAAFLVFGHDFLTIVFGAAFVAAFLPMLILSAGRLAGAVLGSSGSLLVMSGYHGSYARFWMLAAAMNVVLNLLLIPPFGLEGAATATAVTLMVPHVLGWWTAREQIGCDCSPFAQIAYHTPRKR